VLRRSWQPILLVPIVLLAYSGGLSREFTSEDFLILRRLGSGDFLLRALESVTGPWLGASFVSFYRPFSSLLLQFEWIAFGTSPLPYVLLHLVVHASTACLLVAWLGRLLPDARRVELFLAALVFTLYPLHPNTVLFIASFATLFATFFIVATLYLESAGRRRVAMTAATLALLSYEQAVVLPGLVLVFDVAAKPGGWRPRLRLWPYFALTAAFLLLRGSALNQLGGYDDFSRQMYDATGLLRALADVMSRVFVPFYAVPSGRFLILLVAVVLAGVTALAIVRRREPGARVLIAAMVAIPLVQAPFFFVSVVPGNGRYFYLASAFAAIVVWQSVRAMPGRGVGLPATALGIAAIVCVLGLAQVVDVYRDAAARAMKIRVTLAGALPGRVFVAGLPQFVHRWGLPVAQVFHWGIADALQPPFSERTDLSVYPLPELAGAGLTPLLQRPDLGRVVRLGEADQFDRVTMPPVLPAVLDTVRDVRSETGAPFLRVTALPGTSLTVIVIAQGSPSVFPLPPGGEVVAEVPDAFRESMLRLYGAPIFFWVEARNALGELVAVSEVIELPAAA